MSVKPKSSKVQREKFYLDGSQYERLKPFNFKIFLNQKGCDDYDSLLIDFAKEFGLEKDVSPKELTKFLDANGVDDWEENIKWLVKHKFIKEVTPSECFAFGVKFYDKKENELMLISIDNNFSLLDLKIGNCPYGLGEKEKSNVSRKDLWDYLGELTEEDFENFLKTAH